MRVGDIYDNPPIVLQEIVTFSSWLFCVYGTED